VVERFEHHTAEIRRARRLVRTSLQAWGLGAHADALELAASELVTNALVHGGGQIEVRLSAEGDEVRLEVGDEGPSTEPPRPTRTSEALLGGWGLRLVEEISHSWGASTTSAQTRVWMVRRTLSESDPGEGAGFVGPRPG
jgi:anti-sigma regulatory factor (Ser/Thr protein kinase)